MISDALQEILLETVSKDKKTKKNQPKKKVKNNKQLAEEISGFIKDFKSKKVVEKVEEMKKRKARPITKAKKKPKKASVIKQVELPKDPEHKVFTVDNIENKDRVPVPNNKIEEPKPNKMVKSIKEEKEIVEEMVSIDTLTEDEFFDYMINGEQPEEYLELSGNLESEFDSVEELDADEEAKILDLVRDNSVSKEDAEAFRQDQIEKAKNPQPVEVPVEKKPEELITAVDPVNIEEIPQTDDIADIMNKLSSISFEETPYEEPVEVEVNIPQDAPMQNIPDIPVGTQPVPMDDIAHEVDFDNPLTTQQVNEPVPMEEDVIAGMPADGTTNGLGLDPSMVTKQSNTNMPMDSRKLSEFQNSIQQTISEKDPQSMSNNEFANVGNIPEVGMDLSSEAEAIMNKFKNLETE